MGTAKLGRYWGRHFKSSVREAQGLDVALGLVAGQAGYDGLFWDETLDPDRLSAPRAVILPARLGGWRAKVDESCGAPGEWGRRQ